MNAIFQLKKARLCYNEFLLNIIAYAVIFISLSFASFNLYASVVIGSTRVFFSESMGSVDIKIRNTGAENFLIVSKVLTERERENVHSKNKTKVFNAIPPAFSLKGMGERILRITKGDLSSTPRDRESLFYLSVASIPQGRQMDNTVQIAVRSWIKLIYRPSSIQKFDLDNVAISLRNDFIHIENNTPYYLSIPYLKANNKIFQNNINIAPFASESLDKCDGVGSCNIKFNILNEDGSLSEEKERIIDRM